MTVMDKDCPTFDAPVQGVVTMRINDRDMLLAEAEWWVDGKQAVVRSREFDCFATGPDLQKALENFGAEVYVHADRLQKLEDHKEATLSEREALQVLAARLSRIYLEERRGAARRRFWPRRRDHHRRGDSGKLRPVPVGQSSIR